MRSVVGYDMTAPRRRPRSTRRPASAPRTSTWSSCTTASPPTSCITYEALGLTPEGTAEKFIVDGDNTYGGRVVTNPSGGLLSKGHPLGATGLAQCAELVWQLRGQAEQRQVEGAQLALQHNLGLGGACVVTLYEKVAMIDRRHIGRACRLPAAVERAACASSPRRPATGPGLHRRRGRARRGPPDLPVPPTFSVLPGDGRPDPRAAPAARHRLPQLLHGEQRFSYHAMAHAGDTLRFEPRIADIYDKKGGALEFVVVDTEVTRTADVVAVLTETLVVRWTAKWQRDDDPGGGHRGRHGAARHWRSAPISRLTLALYAARRAITTRSTSTSISRRRPAWTTCSRTACCRWPTSGAWSPTGCRRQAIRSSEVRFVAITQVHGERHASRVERHLRVRHRRRRAPREHRRATLADGNTNLTGTAIIAVG